MIHSLFSREARRTTKGGSFRPTGDFFDLHGEHVARYVWAGQFLKNLRVLDAGCGHGYGSDYLAKRIATHVLGIDSDPSAISFALCNYTRHNLDFRVMDVTKILFPPESFDAIVSFEVIEHLSNVDNYLEGIYKTLKHGGVFIMSTQTENIQHTFISMVCPRCRYTTKGSFTLMNYKICLEDISI